MASDASYALDFVDLKSLSMPVTLRFMLGVELDLFACTMKAAGSPFSVKFPPLAYAFEKLLRNCAARFHLDVSPEDEADKRPKETDVREVTVHGSAILPLLRYVDYLPGKLHVDEIFTRFNIKPINEALLLTTANGAPVFSAHAIPYDRFKKVEDSDTQGGTGHYYLLEMGLQLATHAHLVHFALRQPVKDFDKAIRKFQGFSGWAKFDLRWEDERNKVSGILVFPTVADAVELLEAYEDEDESNEENRLPFTLSPVAPCTHVPFMEDSQMKKTRGHHWAQGTKFWEIPGDSSKDRYTVVVTNFPDRATIEDIMKLFDKDKTVVGNLYVDDSPHRRRRLFIQFEDSESCKAALDMDARHYHGAPLRISVAPPYVSITRCGIELASLKGNGKQPAPISPALGGKRGMNVEAKEFVPRFGLSPKQQPAMAPSDLPPPPLYPEPPSYPEAATRPPAYDEAAKSPPAYFAPPRGVPPAYSATPPAYPERSPPAYSQSPNASFGANNSSFGANLPPPAGPPPMYLPPTG